MIETATRGQTSREERLRKAQQLQSVTPTPVTGVAVTSVLGRPPSVVSGKG